MKKIKFAIIAIVLLLFSYPSFIVIRSFYNDGPLRTYLQEHFIQAIKHELTLSLSFHSDPEMPELYLKIGPQYIDSLNMDIETKLELYKHSNIFGLNDFIAYPAKLIGHKGGEYNIDIRLRGDMPANYNEGLHQSTFRFDIKGNKLFMGKRKLSLIRPKLENYRFYGYLFYKFYKSQGIVSNDFQFVHLFLNDQDLGVYILQEGFTKELLEENKRQESLLFRFVSDCRSYIDGIEEINSYEKKRIVSSDILTKKREAAIYQFKQLDKGIIVVDSIFDVDAFGKYMALSDLFYAHHSMKCHNARLHYDIKSNKFFPIAWDPASYDRYDVNLNIGYKGHNYDLKEVYENKKRFPVHYLLSKSRSFWQSYVSNLYYYTHNRLIEEFIWDRMREIQSYEPMIYWQNGKEVFRQDWIINRIQGVRSKFLYDKPIKSACFKSKKELWISSVIDLPIHIDHLLIDSDTFIIDRLVLPQESIMLVSDSFKTGFEKLNIQTHELLKDSIMSYKVKVY